MYSAFIQILIFQVQNRMTSEIMYLEHYYINGKKSYK